MRVIRSSGSVRGVRRKPYTYRDPPLPTPTGGAYGARRTEDENTDDVPSQLRSWLLAGAATHWASLEQLSVAVHTDDLIPDTVVVVCHPLT